jgi:succinate dehydrogenase / fumarate reductase iron-sulfur subunit
VLAGERGKGAFIDYSTDITEGMVVLDAMHQIQAENANDLAIRWNCKAGKCGSCSAEINGNPKLMCMTRMDELPADEPVTVEPMRAFPHVRDLVTDVSWNFEAKKKIRKFKPRAPDAPDGTWRMDQVDVDRVQEFRSASSASCARTSVTCCATTRSMTSSSGRVTSVYAAALEMHPLDTEDRLRDLKDEHAIGYCNITKCCTKVCPEHITITDNAIIPLKERVVDEFYDPFVRLVRLIRGKRS